MRLFKREEGSVAVQFALLALPLCVLTFGLMDVNRATVAKQRLQDALDAATLLAAKTTTATTDTALAAVGTPALNANLTNLSGATLSSSGFHLNGAYIDSTATIQMTPIVANLWMSGNMNITATSQVVRTMDDLEVSLVLDNTGSMASKLGSVTKISALKTAAASLVDTLAAAAANSTDPNAVKYAVVPFSMTVNVGASNKNSSWITGIQPTTATATGYGLLANDIFTTANTDRFALFTKMGMTWGGCVESRPAPYDVQDTAPSTGTPDSMFVPYFYPDEPDAGKVTYKGSGVTYTNSYINKDGGSASTNWTVLQGIATKYDGTKLVSGSTAAGAGPNYGCSTAPLLRLTTSASTAKTTLNSMVATGNTNVAMGLMWGWHTLTPHAPFSDGVAYGTAHHDKIIILLTDGDNTNDEYSDNPENSIYTGIGYAWQGRLIDTNGNRLPVTSTGTDRMNAIDGRELALCANMKASPNNIIIYSIGVGVSTHSKGLLQTCASGADHYYDVTNASQLTSVFNAIAGSIQNLRISK
jgi:Flp pilus assembly protein TadG